MAWRPEDVPQAVAPTLPCWPLPSHSRRFSSDFGDPRRTKGRARFHAGEDLDGERGDVVRSMEAGIVTGSQGFAGPFAHALLVLGDSGTTVLYGEIEPASWAALGVRVGSRVERCQPIARLGLNRWGSTMLHLETYQGRVSQNRRWYVGDPAPVELRNPYAYLKRAAKTLDTDPQTPAPSRPSQPSPPRPPSPRPPASDAGGIVVIVALALAFGFASEWGRG